MDVMINSTREIIEKSNLSPITLDLQTVIANAQKYYKEGMLTAQHPDKEKRICTNFLHGDESYRCAVAASYPKEWVGKGLAPTFNVGVMTGAIFCKSLEDRAAIGEIQVEHDAWASASRVGNKDAEVYEQKFKALIGL